MRFDGCFYASGGVRQLKTKGKPWQGYLKYKTPDGTWKQVTKMLDGTGKRDAERLLCEWQEEMEHRAEVSVVKDAKQIKKSVGNTVAEEVSAYLDEQLADGTLEKSSYSMQVRALRRQIAPYFADIRFEDLTRAQVKAWVAKQLETYAQKTVEVHFAVLAKTYAHAVAEDRLAYNPCEHIKIKKAEGKKEINALDAKGIAEFVEAVESSHMPSRVKCAHLIILYTGLRAQEICGLRWRDVNQPAGTITVNTVIGKDELNKVEYLKEPKSKAGHRVIPILPELDRVLNELRDIQLAEYRKVCPTANELPMDYFCMGKEGGRIWHSPVRLSCTLLQFCKRNEIYGTTGRPITPHALRHTFATMGVASHMDIKSLSSILGHAKASMTLDVYARADEQAVRQGMMQLGNYLKEQERTGGFSDFQ